MILVDTSVWLEVFRAQRPLKLESVVVFDDIVTCLPVIQEVLRGFRDERAFRIAKDAMNALPVLESPLSGELFQEAVDLYRVARKSGRTVRSSVDCLIAACAIRAGAQVLHRDRDFAALASVSPLQERNLTR